MSDEERVKIICMYCNNIIADVSKEEIKTRKEFFCSTCNQTVKLKSMIKNIDGYPVYLN